MSVYYTDFSEYTTGVQPSDWTERWHTGVAASTVESGSGLGGKQLEIAQATNERYLLSWDDVDTDPDVEVLAKVRYTGNPSNSHTFIMCRASGTDTNETAYVVHVYPGTSQLRIGKYVSATYTEINNVAFSIAADTWFWIRFRVNGTSLKVRHWQDGSAEPATWDLDVTDSSIAAGGWVGFGNYISTADPDCDWFSVGTGGDTAPGIVTATATIAGAGSMSGTASKYGAEILTFTMPIQQEKTFTSNIQQEITMNKAIQQVKTFNAEI